MAPLRIESLVHTEEPSKTPAKIDVYYVTYTASLLSKSFSDVSAFERKDGEAKKKDVAQKDHVKIYVCVYIYMSLTYTASLLIESSSEKSQRWRSQKRNEARKVPAKKMYIYNI